MKAIWHGATLAESDQTVVVEGNHYFPPDSINRDHFVESATHTTCGWKGEASYYDIVVDEAVNKDAAWFYPEPKPAAANIKSYVAFWKGVLVVFLPLPAGETEDAFVFLGSGDVRDHFGRARLCRAGGFFATPSRLDRVSPYQSGVSPYQSGVSPYQSGVSPYQSRVSPYQSRVSGPQKSIHGWGEGAAIIMLYCPRS